jgi:hypothetical protein
MWLEGVDLERGPVEGGGNLLIFRPTTAFPSTVYPFSCLASILSARNAFPATFIPSMRTGLHLMQEAGTSGRNESNRIEYGTYAIQFESRRVMFNLNSNSIQYS